MFKTISRFLFFAIIFFSCSIQSTVASTIKPLQHNKGIEEGKGNNGEFVEGVFIRSGVGYQGYSQEEIDALQEIRVPSNTKNITEAINKAIVKASKNKSKGKQGGKVIIEKGNYVVGTIVLKSNVHIRLEEGVVLQADQTDPKKIKKAKLVFDIGRNEYVENVSIIGEGTEETRAIIGYKRESTQQKVGGSRAFRLGAAKNVFIQNVTIQDDKTRFSGVVFAFKNKDFTDEGRASNVTVDHVRQINASYGYGLIQANVGKNLLFTNLICSGGVCARIETDNRYSKSPIGVANVRVENVTSIKGKAAVFLQPHTIINGDVHIDGAHSIGSQMTIEIRPGFEDPEGKGRFGENSSIKNVSAVYSLNSVVSFAGRSILPKCLLPYFKKDISVDPENLGVRQGPSVCAIGDFVGQFKIDVNTVSASIPDDETNPDNSLEARKLIANSRAYRGNDLDKQCGAGAYE